MLILAGAETKKMKSEDMEPIYSACHSGKERIMELFLRAGATPNVKDKKEVKARAMVVTQMEFDVNKEVQKLGRISRTGQVYRRNRPHTCNSKAERLALQKRRCFIRVA